jgi:hypothetical protein
MSVLVQLKTAYEDLGMTPEQIAEDQELDLVAVKSGLMQCSSKYRKDCGQEDVEEDRLNFSNEQLEDANKVIHDIMMSSEDDGIRLKAAMYLRDDKKGRREVVRAMAGQQFNILMFNEAMQTVRAKAEEAKRKLLGGNTPIEA